MLRDSPFLEILAAPSSAFSETIGIAYFFSVFVNSSTSSVIAFHLAGAVVRFLFKLSAAFSTCPKLRFSRCVFCINAVQYSGPAKFMTLFWNIWHCHIFSLAIYLIFPFVITMASLDNPRLSVNLRSIISASELLHVKRGFAFGGRKWHQMSRCFWSSFAFERHILQIPPVMVEG